MRTLWWFIYFGTYLIAIFPMMKKAQKYDKEGNFERRDEITEKYVKKWARDLLRVAGVDVEVVGKENIPNEPAVFVSNHQGNFDIPIILGYLDKPKGIVAKVEIKKMPIIRTWMGLFNCVFIDRSNARNSMDGMKKSIENVKNGYSMVIFPEGTRSRSSEVAEFKSGAFMVATKSKAPLVPIRIEGSYKVMEANKNLIKPAKVKLIILPPVPTEGLTREETKALPQKIRELISQSI